MARVEAGETVTIAKDGVPSVRRHLHHRPSLPHDAAAHGGERLPAAAGRHLTTG
ncbi:hypothetical protein OG971_18505 [Streptomyces sp. NBC_00847]|nr:hypothetical protein [Streptomyces sp. NBC_00847]